MFLNSIRHLRYPLALFFVAATIAGNSQNQNKSLKVESNLHTISFLSPNPFRDVLNLSNEAIKPHFKLEIYSLIGELILSRNAESTIRLPKLPRGIYLARLTNEKGQQVLSQKIVKI